MNDEHTYTVIRSFRHHGRNVMTGERVTLTSRQAKYLIGTHLEPPTVAQSVREKSVKRIKGN